jgi:hypothetical protein
MKMTNQSNMKFRAHIEGFVGHFGTVDELIVWANGLAARYSDLYGKKLQIWKAKSIASGGTAAVYSPTPDREVVVGTR